MNIEISNRDEDVQENFEEPLPDGNSPDKEKEEVNLSPDLVEKIERLNVHPFDKISLLAVAGRIKPATFFAFKSSSLAIGEIESFLSSTNFKFKIEKAKRDRFGIPMPGGITFTDILVAGNDGDLGFLDLAINNGEELLGTALGFPESAVEAYVGKREKLNKKELPDEVKKSDAFRFCNFVLSADNWQEEIKQGQEYADLVKEVSPNIYREFLLDCDFGEKMEKNKLRGVV